MKCPWIAPKLIPIVFGFGMAAGCGTQPERVAVEGVVRRNGHPLANVQVTFVPDVDKGSTAGRAAGISDERGAYRLASEDQGEGIPVGAYRIILEDMDLYRAPRTGDGTLVKSLTDRIPAKFRDPLQTPLLRPIGRGDTRIDLDIGHSK